MKKQALVLGLTAVIYSFLFLPLGVLLLMWANFDLSFKVTNLVCMAAGFLVAWKLAPVVEGEDEPPPLLTLLLVASAGYFLLFKLLGTFGIGFGINKFSLFLHRVEGWALIVAALALSRFFKPRLMLFVGLMAFTLQFNAGGLLMVLGFNVPKLLLSLVTLAAAIFISRSFCVGHYSPADNVSKPLLLWFFAAAGIFVMIAGGEGVLIYGWKEKLVWAAFLLSFVLLVDAAAPEDPEPKAAGLGADYGRMFLVFVATFVVVSAVFQVHEIVDDWMPYSWGVRAQTLVPMLACAALAIALMKYLQIGLRMPEYPPGRAAMLWGAILYGVAILAGGSIFGGISGEGKLDFLLILVFVSVVLVPIATLALILLGTGLLKLLFSLNARPRG